MFQRRAFFAKMAGLLSFPLLPARVSARPKNKKPIVIDIHADRKHFQQYEVFDADIHEPILFAIFYADEAEGIIRFWVPFAGRLEAYLQRDRDRGIKFEITGQGTRVYHGSSSLEWIEMRRNIRILKKMSDQERFQAQVAIT